MKTSPNTEPIPKARERVIVYRMLIEAFRAINTERFAFDVDYMLIAMTVFIGHVEDKPTKSAKVAQYLNLPRSTVIRRLQMLQDLGYIAKTPKGYLYVPDGQRTEVYVNRCLRAMRLIHEASDALRALSSETSP